MSYILRSHNLTKVFGKKEVVSNVSMNVKKGEIYGFLGPNGAGKTTVMKMISNLVKPTAGEIEIFGSKLTDTSYEVLKRMGTIIEYPVFYEKLTAQQNLELHCEYMGYYDKKAIDRALELVKLVNANGKAVKEFSLGMKQRLGIARAIITKPEFLMLDEPINGLDPVGIKEIRNLMGMLSKEYGITILVSSHILAEIEQIADTIGVISNGKLIEEVTMDSIRERNAEYIEIATNDSKKAAYLLANQLGIENFRVVDNAIRVYEEGIPQSVITKALVLGDVNVSAIAVKSSSLEDYFIKLIDEGMESAMNMQTIRKGGDISA